MINKKGGESKANPVPIDVASAVVKTERPEFTVLTKQFLFLNPEQLRIGANPANVLWSSR